VCEILEKLRTILALFLVVLLAVAIAAGISWYTWNELDKPKSQIKVEKLEVKEKEWRECRLYFVKVKINVVSAQGESVFISRITALIINTNISWTISPNITIDISQSKEFTAILHPKVGLIYSEYCETFEIGVEVDAVIHYEQFGKTINRGVIVKLPFSAKVRICGAL